jgi:hypothetical protein
LPSETLKPSYLSEKGKDLAITMVHFMAIPVYRATLKPRGLAQAEMHTVIERIFGLNASILSFTPTLVNTDRHAMGSLLELIPEK